MSSLLRFVAPVVLLSLSLPLALLATITTFASFAILWLRVAVVQFELCFAIITSWLTILLPKPPQTNNLPIKSALIPSVQVHSKHHRRTSIVGQSPSPPRLSVGTRPPSKSESFASISGPEAPVRDFEGVGGWRLADDGQDDAVWLSLNSRLELPLADTQRQRRHQRSLSGTERARLSNSPMGSHSRTPNTVDGMKSANSGYFDFRVPHNPPMSPEETIIRNRMEERRKSISSHSATSLL